MAVLQTLLPKFQATVLGAHSPGRPFEFHASNGSGWMRYTAEHEQAHEALTQTTTLGAAALIAGWIDVYSTDDVRRARVQPCLAAYFSKCYEVHEGVATAYGMNQWAVNSVLEETHPPHDGVSYPSPEDVARVHNPSYVVMANRVVTLVRQLHQLVHRSNPIESIILGSSLMLGIGMAAMSPEVDDDFFERALSGEGSSALEFSLAWRRFQAICDAQPERVVEEMDSMLSKECWKDDDLISIKYLAAKSIATAVGMPYSPPPDFKRLITKFAPEILNRFQVVRPLDLTPTELNAWAARRQRPLIRPLGVAYQTVDSVAVLKELEADAARLLVAEISQHEEGDVVVAMHLFDPLGGYTTSVLARRVGPDDIRSIFNRTSPLLATQRGAFVVARETLRDHGTLQGLLQNYDLIVTPLYETAFNERSRDTFGSFEGLTLQQVTWGMEIEWELVASRIPENRLATPVERAYIWTLRNGLAAALRWHNFYLENRGALCTKMS